MNQCKHTWEDYNYDEKIIRRCNKCGLIREKCKYCEEIESSYNNQKYFTSIEESGYFSIYETNEKYEIVFDGAVGVKINYCPICGRKLGD